MGMLGNKMGKFKCDNVRGKKALPLECDFIKTNQEKKKHTVRERD